MTVQNVSNMPVRVCGSTLRPFSLAVIEEAAWTGWLEAASVNHEIAATRLKIVDGPEAKPEAPFMEAGDGSDGIVDNYGVVELPPEKPQAATRKTSGRKTANGGRRKPSGRAR